MSTKEPDKTKPIIPANTGDLQNPTPPVKPTLPVDPNENVQTWEILVKEDPTLKDNAVMKQIFEQNIKMNKTIDEMNQRELESKFTTKRNGILDELKALSPRLYEKYKDEPDLRLIQNAIDVKKEITDGLKDRNQEIPESHIHVPSHKKPGSSKYICQGCGESFE